MIRIRLLSKLADTIIVSGVKRTVILVPIKTHFDLSYYHHRRRVLYRHRPVKLSAIQLDPEYNARLTDDSLVESSLVDDILADH